MGCKIHEHWWADVRINACGNYRFPCVEGVDWDMDELATGEVSLAGGQDVGTCACSLQHQFEM